MDTNIKIIGAQRIAKTFFIIGTLLFVTQLIFKEFMVLTIIGYYYVLLAIILNLFFILILLSGLFLKESVKETFQAIGVLLLNIPIAYIYFVITVSYVL